MAKFEKVSLNCFINEWIKTFGVQGKDILTKMYEEIKIPTRATSGSAGYDFCSPLGFKLKPGETIKIPTGIRCRMNDNWVLLVLPRSGLGFKYRLRLDNTVGVIDSDYYYSDNQGNIILKITNESDNKVMEIPVGGRIAQGIFVKYGITEDDDAHGIRNGGFGSTGR